MYKCAKLQWFVHFIVLNINFGERDTSIYENQTRSIRLRFREAQNKFSLTLFPVTIDAARDPANFNLSDVFITADFSAPLTQATAGKVVTLG